MGNNASVDIYDGSVDNYDGGVDNYDGGVEALPNNDFLIGYGIIRLQKVEARIIEPDE